MKSISLRDTAEFVGIVAIVASLIFVGLQLRQAQQIALSAAYQARSDSSMAIRLAPLESETLLSALTKIRLNKFEELTPEEVTAKINFYAGELVYLENVHYQYVSGFVSEEQWQTNVSELKFIFRDPDMRRDIDQFQGVWRESFFAEIKRAIAEIEKPR